MQMAPAGLPTADSSSMLAVGVRERFWEVGLGLSPRQLNSSGINPLANSGILSQAAHCPWAQEGEGGDYRGRFSGPATSTQGCHSTLQPFHGGFKTHQLTPQISNGLKEAAAGKFAPLAHSLGPSIPSASSCRTGAVAVVHRGFPTHFFIFSRLIWPSSLGGCQDSFVLIPGTPGQAPGRRSPGKSWPTPVTAPRGDQRWCVVTPQPLPGPQPAPHRRQKVLDGSSHLQAQGPGRSTAEV